MNKTEWTVTIKSIGSNDQIIKLIQQRITKSAHQKKKKKLSGSQEKEWKEWIALDYGYIWGGFSESTMSLTV